MTLGDAAKKLGVGHNTVREFLIGSGLAIDDNLNAKLSMRQCRKVFLMFVPCERHEIERLFKEFLAEKLPYPTDYGRIETEVSVPTKSTHFESNRRRH